MSNLLVRILGVPASEPQVRAQVEKFVASRGVDSVRAVMSENLSHMTGKSGALLAAQGIFVVVATYLLDQRASRTLALVCIVLLTVAALAVITNLRSVFIGHDPGIADAQAAEFEIVVRMSVLASRRGLVFNIALYLTFLAILLLGIGSALVEAS